MRLRPLILPAAAVLCGLAWLATPGLPPEPGGVALCLGLAWGAARCFDLLLLRAARVARRPAPYPRLLGDLVRGLLFLLAGLAILLLVFHRPAIGLVTTSGVVVAVVGFALRNVIGDLFSGLALGIDAPYRIGDWIETAEGSIGRVTELSWRTTRLETRDGVTLVVPNGLIATHRLVHWGAGRYRAALRLGLDAALPPERVKRLLLAAALGVERDIPGLAPDVVLQELTEGIATYLLRFTVPDYGREAACRDAVAEAALGSLHRAGIAPAGPVRTWRRAPAAQPAPHEAMLRRLPLFRDFPAEELAALAAAMQRRSLPAGATVIRQGEPGCSLLWLEEGALEVRRAGLEAPIDLLLPGAVLGEMSLLTGQPRRSTVTARTGVELFEIDRAHLDPILRRRPELAEGLAAIMAARQAQDDVAGPAVALAGAPPAGRQEILRRLREFFGLTRG